ncbi:MAG: thioredoxin domain-containing protein, partial [Planctomycetota bacterium]
MPNRLADETSPYLLQHAENPVDWYPWGEEAFAEARRRDVPIFLSVGYSTCYWCHVMERQSFENEAIAALMNERFVCVKVDREERPDVDQLYMTAVQVQTGQGGWPMSVFLLPDGRPFWGGTYFPPQDMQGRPGFPTVLTALSDHFRSDRAELEKQAEQITSIVQRLAEPKGPDQAFTLDVPMLLDLERQMRSDFEPTHGGFGNAPKFPRQTLLQTALQFERDHPDEQRRQQLKQTLDAMAAGGIRDHLGGGFHRYSTDARWLVPHFEIMLYDQAMLLDVYADAAELFDDDGYRSVARGIADFVLREMTSSGGAFYTAFDAEVDAVEGDPYVWTADEVREVIGDDEDFLRTYGLLDGPNFHDPHGNATEHTHNVLRVAGDFRAAETKFAEQRAKLLEARNKRKQPMLDTKIITAWNGLMIVALRKLGDAKYVDASERACAWLLEHHWDGQRLLRSSRDGTDGPAGVLEDYAYLHRATPRDDLQAVMTEKFGDGRGGFYDTDGGLVVRQKSAVDSPLPAACAVAGGVEVVRQFGQNLREHPGGMSTLLGLALDVAPVDVAVDQQLALQREQEEVVQFRGQWVSERELQLVLHVSDGYHLHATPVGEMHSLVIGVVGHAATLKFPASESATFAYA